MEKIIIHLSDRIASIEHHLARHPEHRDVKEPELKSYKESRDLILSKLNA